MMHYDLCICCPVHFKLLPTVQVEIDYAGRIFLFEAGEITMAK